MRDGPETFKALLVEGFGIPIAVVLLSATVAKMLRKEHVGSMERKVSIVIPCRNEQQYIAACIGSILAADTAGCKVSILVCDGMSEDDTRAIVTALARENPSVHLIDNLERTTPRH